MARDFIYIDSDKVKQILKNALEMGEGDLSGNKLGLSSKVVPVVSLNEVGNPETATLAVTAVQNTWYDVLDASSMSVLVYGMRFTMKTLAETIEFRLLYNDGTTVTGSVAAVAGTQYYAFLDITSDVLVLNYDSAFARGASFAGTYFYCKNFKVQMRKTTANAANELDGTVIYAEK